MIPNDELPTMLRVDEAARLLRVSRSSAYDATARFLRTGGREGLPCIRVGRTIRIPRAALEAWIEAQVDAPADWAEAEPTDHRLPVGQPASVYDA